jgi:PAS domain S-box-containing protein
LAGEAAAAAALIIAVAASVVMLFRFAFGLEPLASSDPQAQRRSWPFRYGAAILVVALTVLFRAALTPIMGGRSMPFTLFFPAVWFAAWFGGLWPGALCIVLSGLAGSYFFAEPTGTLYIRYHDDQVALLMLVIVGFGMAVLSHAQEQAVLRALQAENAERQERQRFETTLASIGDAVITTDANGNVTSLNSIAQSVTGWTEQEAVGKPLPQVFVIRDEATGREVENPATKALREGRVVGLGNHTVLLQKNGAAIPIDDSAAPIRQPNGEVQGTVLVFRDITARKRAEEALMQATDRLREAHAQLAGRAVDLEKLVQQRTARLNEIIGDLEAFSYSIVHDMRAPLRAMQGFAELLGEECGSFSPAAGNYVARIKAAAQRMDQLIQDGFSYSRLMKGEFPLTAVDFGALLRGIIETYPAFQPPQVEINLDGVFPLIHGNEAALTQCISNLLGNAVKFVAPGVTPRVRIWAEKAGGRVRLSFRDNGIGIARDHYDKIFHIFQRLDLKYEGTGVGLAIVKKAVERMGGQVGVESEVGHGTTFWLDLAAAEEGMPLL